MATISVTIDGKTYRMACDEGQEDHLAGLAAELDKYILHLKSSFGEIGDHRLSVMAGIMIMDEMAEQKKELENLRAVVAQLQENQDEIERDAKIHESQADAILARTALKIEEFANRLKMK